MCSDILYTKLNDTLNIKLSYEQKNKVKGFCSNAKSRWLKSSYNINYFKNDNKEWLQKQMGFSVHTTTTIQNNAISTKKKDIFLCSEGQKRKRTKAIRENPTNEIAHSMKMVLRAEGKIDASKVIEHVVIKRPDDAKRLRMLCEGKVNCLKTQLYSNEKALSIIVDAKLSKSQYNILRDAAIQNEFNPYPSYYQIQKAKEDCYPSSEYISVSEVSAKIQLQALLNHTTYRILKTIPNLTSKKVNLVCKWGCDGSSGQSQYKQKFENALNDDSSIFLCSLVPLRLHEHGNINETIWNNVVPSSTWFCRPIKFQFVKETDTLIRQEINEINSEINELKPFIFEAEDYTIEVVFTMTMTMVDGKVCSAVSNNKSSMRCYICNASPAEMNNLNAVYKKNIQAENYNFGLSSLHAWIRFMECLLHISYNLPFKKWSAKTDEHKKMKEEKKRQIQFNFKRRLGLIVDVVKQGIFIIFILLVVVIFNCTSHKALEQPMMAIQLEDFLKTHQLLPI